MKCSRIAFCCGVAASALAAGSAHAQQAPTSGESIVQEIIVTATRREESLQKVAGSVAVISADTIKASGASSFSDLGFSAANVVFNESVNLSGFRGVSIRGVQGRTGIYIDDVLIGNAASANVAVNDVDRVEILRGPQGTTFGRNTLGGAINTVTKRPSFTWKGSLAASYGDYDRKTLDGYVSGPIIDDVLAFKASAFTTKHDGYETDANGNGVMTEDSYGGRGALLWKPTSKLSLLLSGDYQHDDPIVNAYHLVTGPGSQYVENTIATSFMNLNRRENYGGSLRVDYDLGHGVDLVSISSKRRTRSDFKLDYDFLPQNIFYENGPRIVDELSQEFRLSGGGAKVRWLAGLYYYDSKVVDRDSSFLGTDYASAATGGKTLGQLGLPGAVSATYQRDDNSSLAAFGSVDVQMSDRLKLTLGGRYARDTTQEETYKGDLVSRLVIGTLTPPVLPIVAYPKIVSYRLTPSASLKYALDEETNVYFTVGTGYQTGGYNASGCNGTTTLAACQYRPEKLTSYEIGYKTRLFDRKLLLNAAAYYLSYSDLQRTQRFFYTTGATTVQIDTTTNAAKAIGKGVELEFQARPTPALSFDGSLGYQKAWYDQYFNAPVRVAGSAAPQLRDLSGEELPYAPNWTGSLAGNLNGETPLGAYRLRAEVQYRGDYRNADGPFYLYQIPAETKVNLSVENRFRNGVTLAVKARNIFDKRYIINQSYDASFTGKFYVARSDPRTYWLELRYDF